MIDLQYARLSDSTGSTLARSSCRLWPRIPLGSASCRVVDEIDCCSTILFFTTEFATNTLACSWIGLSKSASVPKLRLPSS